MNNNITDVFFDLDHTLWDFDKNSALTFKLIFKKHNVNANLKTFLNFYEPINLEYWKLYREEKISKPNLRYRRLKDTFDAMQLIVSDEIINTLSEDYITYLTTYNYLFDGTIEILEYLKSKYKLHIITNGFKEAQKNKLEKSKIAHYFNTVTDSEMVGVKKPNPAIFDFALNLANARKENSIMIGDNLEADIEGALNIGLDAICFNYHKVEIPAQIKKIDYLLDLKNYL